MSQQVIDYRKILREYIKHVVRMEGVTFLDDGGGLGSPLSVEEDAALAEVEKEALE